MIGAFLQRRANEFRTWWHAPATFKDRATGALVGAIGAFWIGALGRGMLGTLPVSLTTVGLWGLGAAVVGVALGIVFPKMTTCILFPFTTFGISN